MKQLFRQFLKIILFLGITFLFFQCSQCATFQYARNEIIGPSLTHKNIYITNEFDDIQKEHIKSAARNWEKKTNGISSFYFVEGFDGNFDSISDKRNAIVINTINVNDIKVQKQDKVIKERKEENVILAYYSSEQEKAPVIRIILERMQNQDFESVILHEFGHSLNIPDDYSHKEAIMYWENSGTSEVTNDDLNQFCQLYLCNVSSLK